MIKAYECIYEGWDANYVNVYWALMGDDSKINVPFEIPDFSE